MSSDVLTRDRLKKFPKPVADVLMREVAGHPRLSVRFMDATHLRIYNGSTGHPFQVAASRPAEDALRKLKPWLAKQKPVIEEEPVVVIEKSPLPENDTQQGVKDETKGSQPALSDAAHHVVGFTFDGDNWVCIECGWLGRFGKQGLHLHRDTHTKTLKRADAVETRRKNAAQRKADGEAALRTLATVLGIDLGTVPALQAEIVALKAERDELKAKLAIYDETLKQLRSL